jgi:hypothetical protein
MTSVSQLLPPAAARDGQRHQVMVPVIAARFHRHIVPGPLEHDHMLD